VGKSTLCEFLSLRLSIIHYSASDLISKANEVDFGMNRTVDRLSKNQTMLLASIKLFIEKDRHCLLDGHFCLFDDRGGIQVIPSRIFKKINPCLIIILKDLPQNILNRITKREKSIYDAHTLDSLQREELRHSNDIARLLGVPYLEANPINDRVRIVDFIMKETKLLSSHDMIIQ
jgi:adenylate kinase